MDVNTKQDDSGSTRWSEADPTSSLRDAGRHLAELKAFAQDYLDARVDSVKLSFKKFVVVMVFAAVGLLIAGAMMATGGALLMIGIAQAIGALFDPPKPWIGQLIVGLVVVIGAPTATWFTLRYVTGLCCQDTRKRYDRKHALQRAINGRDVNDAAAEHAKAGASERNVGEANHG
jgi:hypothetical protein